MTHPEAHSLQPAADLSLRSFDTAFKKIEEADFYILACHEACAGPAKFIKEDYRARGIEVDIVYRSGKERNSWFLHGMNNKGPPFCVGTVFSNPEE